MICIYCGKTIRVYKIWNDWLSRDSHYKCYKREQERLSMEIQMEQYLRSV